MITKTEKAAIVITFVLAAMLAVTGIALDIKKATVKEEAEEEVFHPYDPFKSGPRESICPYDKFLKQYADSINWDWHLLAAVAYQESKFDTTARSRRGARGIMQIMPETATKFGITDISDPEQSIRAGAYYLQCLERRYRGIAPDPVERKKFALAAYNAGAGRVSDCVDFARSEGMDPHSWQEIVDIIPQMRDSTKILGLEVIKHGTFQGRETIEFVDRVMALEKRFRIICP